MESQENTEIKTKRNKTKLEHERFLYVFEQFNCDATKKFWRCEQFNIREVKCHGRLHTTLGDNMLKIVGQHTCNNSAIFDSYDEALCKYIDSATKRCQCI